MRILYDGQIYRVQASGGINRYFANIIAGLPETFEPHLTTCQIREVNYPSHPQLHTHSFNLFYPQRVTYRVANYYFRSVAARNQFDVVHPTYYSLLTRQPMRKLRRPIVLTVWDMISEVFADQLDPTGRVAQEKREAIEAAQIILCISHHTKQDLLRFHPGIEDRIRVTHLAADIDFTLSFGEETVPQQPYFLYVGSRMAYKNFDRLLQAFAHVASMHKDVMLAVVGAPWDTREGNLLDDLSLIGKVQHMGLVSDTHLAKLYRCSAAFVYPSLYEGFGIPPLEAMACHTPVIAANTSSIPEVVGDAGVLFDPTSVQELTDILLSMLSDDRLRRQLIKQGQEHVQNFKWSKTVAQTIDAYGAVCG
ncbi:MAG TPA: glycosyltransferase family 1 protein [Abditibacteriaceae bacterium]|jgi:glycosyltransferase involved in cell wall biosynthesis